MNRRCLFSGILATIAVLAGLSSIPFSRAAAPVAEKAAASTAKSVKKPKPPVAPFVPGSWTIAVMPDIQHYSTYYPGLTRLQTQWIAEHKEKYNIVYVLQLGDLTNFNNEKEWDRASRGMAVLDGVVPYAIVPGNHDYSSGSPPRDRLST